MNDVLQDFIHRYVLVFFNNTLIYNFSWSEHLQHVRLVFEALGAHDPHLKRSKCTFEAALIA